MKIIHTDVYGGTVHRREGLDVSVDVMFPSVNKYNLFLPIGKPWEALQIAVLDFLDIPYGENPIETYNRNIAHSDDVRVIIPLHGRGAGITIDCVDKDGNHFSCTMKASLSWTEMRDIIQTFLSLTQEETGLTERMYDEYKKWFKSDTFRFAT